MELKSANKDDGRGPTLDGEERLIVVLLLMLMLLLLLLLHLLRRERVVARASLVRHEPAGLGLAVPEHADVAERVLPVIAVREEAREVRVLGVGARRARRCAGA